MPDPFYGSAAWQKLRSRAKRIWMASGKPCAYCGQPFKAGEQLFVDHIKNRKQHPALALDMGNLCVVHPNCNTRKFHHVENNDKKPIGINGLPDGWE